MRTKLRLLNIARREGLATQVTELAKATLPTFLQMGRVAATHWHLLATDFAEYQTTLCGYDGTPVAAGHAVPIYMPRGIEDLPIGWDDALDRAADQRARGIEPNTLVCLGIVVRHGLRAKGIGAKMVVALKRTAKRFGFSRVVFPARPMLKNRYPLVAFDEYVGWVDEDGLPFDPWLRAQERLGGRPLRLSPKSLFVSGTREEWEEWLGMPLPQTGRYVAADLLQPLHLDVERDIGVYHDPCVWYVHDVPVERRGPKPGSGSSAA